MHIDDKQRNSKGNSGTFQQLPLHDRIIYKLLLMFGIVLFGSFAIAFLNPWSYLVRGLFVIHPLLLSGPIISLVVAITLIIRLWRFNQKHE